MCSSSWSSVLHVAAGGDSTTYTEVSRAVGKGVQPPSRVQEVSIVPSSTSDTRQFPVFLCAVLCAPLPACSTCPGARHSSYSFPACRFKNEHFDAAVEIKCCCICQSWTHLVMAEHAARQRLREDFLFFSLRPHGATRAAG